MSTFADCGDRLQARVQPAADRYIVTLSGELDMLAGPALAELLHTIVADTDARHVEVDVAQVGFLDLAGLRVLRDIHQLAADRGIVFCVCNPQPHVRWLLHHTETADWLLADTRGKAAADAVLDVDQRSTSPASERLPASPADEADAAGAQHAADERERRADDRELLDAERARLLDERSRRLHEHQRWEDIREDQADAREQRLDRREHGQ